MNYDASAFVQKTNSKQNVMIKINTQNIHSDNNPNPLDISQSIEKKKKKKVRVLDLVMALLVTASGALFFLCVTRSIDGVSLLNPWISAMICATVFEIIIILFAVTTAVKKIIIPITIIAFLPSIIFLPVLWHILVVLIAIPIAISGLYAMRRTLFNGLKINMGTIVRSGISYVSFAIVIVVTSQYYFFIQDNEKLVFDASHYISTSNFVVDYLLKTSGMEDVSFNTMTVDDFLQFMIDKTYNTQQAEGSTEDLGMLVRLAEQTGMNNNIKDIENAAQDELMIQMHENLATMLGRDVSGDELISGIFSEMITKQIDTAIQKNAFLNKYKTWIFTVFFFLFVFSLASIVRIFVGWGTRFTFMLMREFRIIRVGKIQRDAEVIIL